MHRELFNDPDMPEEYRVLGKFGNLLWLTEKHNNLITEGLITSYPFENVLSTLSRKYKDLISYIRSDPLSSDIPDKKVAGISLFIKSIYFNEELLDNIKKDVDVYGYLVSYTESYSKEEIGLFIEPKYPTIIDKKHLRNKKVYHITKTKRLDKIMKNGLSPRDTETTFYHPGNRIYLAILKNQTMIPAIKKTLARNKNETTENLVTLEIDPSNLELYIDPNFENNDTNSCIYAFTFRNIPPKNIKISE